MLKQNKTQRLVHQDDSVGKSAARQPEFNPWKPHGRESHSFTLASELHMTCADHPQNENKLKNEKSILDDLRRKGLLVLLRTFCTSDLSSLLNCLVLLHKHPWAPTLCREPQAHSEGEENLPLLSPGLLLGALAMLSMAARLCYCTMCLEDTVCVFHCCILLHQPRAWHPTHAHPLFDAY